MKIVKTSLIFNLTSSHTVSFIQIKMALKPVAHAVDTINCHKWIAVGDIYLDFTLMDYDRYNFNDLYIVHKKYFKRNFPFLL